MRSCSRSLSPSMGFCQRARLAWSPPGGAGSRGTISLGSIRESSAAWSSCSRSWTQGADRDSQARIEGSQALRARGGVPAARRVRGHSDRPPRTPSRVGRRGRIACWPPHLTAFDDGRAVPGDVLPELQTGARRSRGGLLTIGLLLAAALLLLPPPRGGGAQRGAPGEGGAGRA